MNCLYTTIFFNIIAGIAQIFFKSWNQLLYPRLTEVCRLRFETRHGFFLHLIIRRTFSQRDISFGRRNKWESLGARPGIYGGWCNISHWNFSRSAVVTCAEWTARCPGPGTRRVTTFLSFCFEWFVETVSRCHNMQRR